MTNNHVRSVVGLAAAMLLCGGAKADITFSDTEFATANWGFETITGGTGGTATPSQVSGGNPGFARQVITSVNASGGIVYGLSRFGTSTATRYDPAVSGAIGTVDFSIDAKWISGDGLFGQSIGIGAKQGSVAYYAALDVTGVTGLWGTHASLGLTAADFVAMTAGGPIDFSATGAPVRFGFVVANSAPGPASVNTAAYDNFQVVVHSVPAPASVGMAGMVGVVAGVRRRRASR
jgi:hypothetical protein